MKRAVLLVALLAASGCGGNRDRQLASTFEEARLAARRGELSEARTLAERGLARAQPESEWDWTFRYLRGEILLLQHQTAEVAPLVRADVPAGPGFDRIRARQKFLEALVQRSQNRFDDALATLEKARQLAPDARDVQFDIDWLDGQLRMRLGRWAEAETRLNAFIARAEAAGDRFQQARALNDLGMGGVARGRWDEALSRFERVLSFEDLESLSIYSAALSNAGICYFRLGEYERALETQRRSVALHTNRGTRADFAQAVGGLGVTYMMQGDAKAGMPFLRQALMIAKESNLQRDAGVWAGNVAAASIELREWDDAARFNDEARALRIATNAGNLFHNTLNAAQIAQGRGELDDATRLFDEVLADTLADSMARWSAHSGLAGVALARSKADTAATHFEAALETIEKTRAEVLRTDYRLSFMTRLIEFYHAYVDMLVDQGRAERALEVSESSRGRVLSERNSLAPPARASAAALQQVAARSRSVLLSYWLGTNRSYVWAVTGTGVHMVPLPPAPEIESLVRQHQATIDNTMADPLASSATAGDELYKILVEPVLPWIPPGSRVVIVPDRSLHAINFETLPVAGAKRHYFIEDVELQTAPSLSLLSVAPAAPRRAPTLLLMGDPAPRAPEFPALKYASAEIDSVSKYFPADGVTAYKAERASPAAYRTATPERFSYVHFTAHAAANLQSPLDSAVILSGTDDAYKLYARDVAQVPLRAELVTVSACRSAGERSYSGEGLIGFSWAFLRAGANRVIAGLWDVDDRSTVQLMDDLYAKIAAGESAAHALREAKLALIARGGNYAKPYYWGPFQVFTLVP